MHQVFAGMHSIYASADKVCTYPVVFNIPWLLRKVADASDGKADCSRKGVLDHLDLWLTSIAQNSKRAPVFLVGSCKDLIPGWDPEVHLKMDNAELAISNESIKEAHEIIRDHIINMPVYHLTDGSGEKKLNLHLPNQPEGV